MAQPKRPRQRANPGAKPDPAPADPGAPGDVDEPGGVLIDKVGNFTIIPNAFIKDARLSNAAFRLWAYLRSFGSGHHATTAAWPEYDTIRKDLGWGSNTTIARALDELIAAGWMSRRKRYGRVPVYTLNRSPTQSVGMDTSPTESVGTVLQKVDTSPTESVEEQDPKKQDPQEPPPPRRPARAQGGGGDAGKNAPELAEILAMLKANGLDTDTGHIKRLAAVIVQHAPSMEVARAEIEAKAKNIKTGKANRPEGVLYSRLRDMTPDDWKAKTPAPANDAPALIVRRRPQVTP